MDYVRSVSPLIMATLALSGCGAGLYGPSAGELAKSMTAMGTVTTATLEAFPETVRGAMLDQAVTPGTPQRTDGDLLCAPVRHVTYNVVLNQELQSISTGLTTLAGDSPSDVPGLLAATMTPYAVEPARPRAASDAPASDEDSDTPQERARAAAVSAETICRADVGHQCAT
jgi:hypothetical protein